MCRAVPLQGETYHLKSSQSFEYTDWQKSIIFLLGFLISLLPIQIALCPTSLGQTKSNLIRPFLRQPRQRGLCASACNWWPSLYSCCHWGHWVPPNCCSDIIYSFALIPSTVHFLSLCQSEILPEESWKSGSMEKK